MSKQPAEVLAELGSHPRQPVELGNNPRQFGSSAPPPNMLAN
jgi:hypothetical protein